MGHILPFLVHHGYLLVFCWLLAEQAAIPIPSLPLLLACGALIRSGQFRAEPILLAGLAACLIADNLWFQLGRSRGGKILDFVCKMALEPDSCVRRTENVFVRYGMRSLLVSKFIPGLNAVAAPLAGSSGASRLRFMLFDTCGVILWMSTYLSVGYAFSNQLETVAAYVARTSSGMLIAVLGIVVAWIAWKYFERRRFLRKLAIARITPEELQAKLQSGEAVLVVDVRGAAAGAIPGTLHIPVEELAARHAEIPRDRDIILFCT